MQWRIYYTDGATYSDADGPLEDAPGLGVLVIAQRDPDAGRELLHRKDYYYHEGGRWVGCDLFGLWDYLGRPGWRKVVAGRNAPYPVYSAVYEAARTDPELPAKSALLIDEVPL